ncbi:hypothetical protein [Flavobacterium sp. LM4]|uniref:hypothetical protein n=1 Tax=Flavobacterium sp. LM4 TaxID=1938609 RepID=UPI000993E176|nr:hypothetical protein [Flavobacterium sp. LM4]OOV20626.1 hypothetical protein BXU10_13880 [Flavobacterium sp. LM4]
MKKLILTLILSICLISCNSQEKKENKMTTEERLTYISSKIKKYDYEPLYQIKVKTQNCYQILVNDFPVYTYFDKMSGKIGFNINSAILKSGIQTLQIKIYPSYNSQNIQNEHLTNKDFFSLEIEQTSWNKNGHLEKPETILKYELPMYKMDSDDEPDYSQPIDYSQQNQLTKNFTFQAKVPYELKGWSESEDLSKIDKKVLMEKVTQYYYKTIDAFKDKDFDYFNTLYLKADTEWYQAQYFSENTRTTYQKALYETNFNNLEILPLKNYKLSYYCNNTVVALESTSGPNRGNSMFSYQHINNSGAKVIEWTNLFLHIPKGSKELEIIR